MRIRNELSSLVFGRLRTLSDVGDVEESHRYSWGSRHDLVLKERFFGSPNLARVDTAERIGRDILIAGNVQYLKIVVKENICPIINYC
jgi:hypothetical protein